MRVYMRVYIYVCIYLYFIEVLVICLLIHHAIKPTPTVI